MSGRIAYVSRFGKRFVVTRGSDDDMLTAPEYLGQGRLPSHSDPEQLGLIGAGYTYRLLGLTDRVDVASILGAMPMAFTFATTWRPA